MHIHGNKEIEHAISRIAVGSLFYGTVTSADPATKVVLVAPAGPGQAQVMQGLVLAQVLSSAIGIKESHQPPIGANVYCAALTHTRCVILGILPEADGTGAESNLTSRSILGGGTAMEHESARNDYGKDAFKIYTSNLQRPTDTSAEDLVYSNEYGVLLGLFQFLATLKASELAQVQCFVLDDLVRIVSHNYEHLHSMGEFKITHDGKSLNIELGVTHRPDESLGIPSEQNSQILHTGQTSFDDSKQLYQIDDTTKGIERLKAFVGHLGDFVNVMLTLPGNQPVKLNGETPEVPETGLLQLKTHLDGLFVLRSAKGIVLEKTNWIRVPSRIRRSEDPLGDDAAELDYGSTETFEFDDSYTYESQPFLYFLQLRDYLAYTNEVIGYHKFKKHEKDFSINNEYTKERPLSGVTFVDPVTGAAYRRKTSSIVLMPNGGVAMQDAWGSGIAMEGGNIYIQPAKDLVLQPMRNLIGKIGDNISLAARREIDISSTSGGMRLKTDKAIYLYSKDSGIVLHADGLARSENVLPEDDAPAFVNGIVFKAPSNGVYSTSKYAHHKISETSIIDAKLNYIKSSADVVITAESSLISHAEKRILMTSNGGITAFAEDSASWIGNTSTVIGKEGQTFGLVTLDDDLKFPVNGILSEDNSGADFFKSTRDEIERLDERLDLEKVIIGFKTDEEFDTVQFRFLNSSRYNLLDGEDVVPQTLAQQEETVQQGLHQLTPWEEVAVNDTYPFPGADNAELFATVELKNIDIIGGDFINKTDGTGSGQTNQLKDVFKQYTSR